VGIRPPTTEEEPGRKQAGREAIDLLRAAHGYAFLVCACGLKIKVPPDFKAASLKCPRCGRTNEIPWAGVMAVKEALDRASSSKAVEKRAPGPGAPEPLVYKRRGTGWETFTCACGRYIQISPAFCGKTITCRKCGRIIQVEQA